MILALAFTLASCAGGDGPAREGEIITSRDPRDIAQCKRQPDLAWCIIACKKEPGLSWCAK